MQQEPIAAESAAVRMAGYMEKRGKLKLMSSWKKYWFVLEGQLLLYYKSQLDYINLSACRGSLNIGLASCVRPGQGLTLQVVTRTQCVTLRTKERSLQEQWLQALVDSMALPNTSSLKRNTAGTQHFRYSLDNLPAISETEECSSRESVEKKSTLPRRVSRGNSVLHRIRRMGGITYNSPQGSAMRPHNPLVKSTSSPTIQYGVTQPDSQTKEAFLHNLMTVRNLLEETSNRTKVEDDRQSPQSDSTDEKNGGRLSTEYSELILHESLQDENQNTSQVPEETKLHQMSENICYQSHQQPVDDEEEVEYCGYDRVALMNDLKNVEDVEPDLPPRPVKQFPEYEEVTTFQCGLEKTQSNLNDKIPLFKDDRPSKASKKTSGQELHVEGKKKVKKRKNSFLNKFVLRLKRKDSAEVEVQEEYRDAFDESDEEPVYESVTFEPHPVTEPVTATETEPEPAIPAKKQIGMQLEQQLPANTIQELKTRMRFKPQAGDGDIDEDSDDYDTICLNTGEDRTTEGHADCNAARGISSGDHTSSSHAAVKSDSFDHVYAKSKKCNNPTLPKLDIPSLPPRRTHRPTSPWHDVPTNNSPVSPLPPQLTDNQSEGSPIPDNVLNTPQGFQLLKNKWQKAERCGEWNREHQQVAFPNKTRERIMTPSESNIHSLESFTNICNGENSISKIIFDGTEYCDSLEKITSNELTDSGGLVLGKVSSDTAIENTKNPFYALSNQTNITTIVTPLDTRDEYLTDNDMYFKIINPSSDLPIDLVNTKSIEEGPCFTKLPIQTGEETQRNVDASTEEKENPVASLLDADDEIVGINRYSDELHLLLTQLAEITSAPLFHIGATKSLITTSDTFSALDAELGPIRRRRHSDPDYDVPRPHQSLFVRDTPEISMSPDSLEPALDHFITDIC